jgi:predicted aconitase with swiveling domain
MRRLLLAVALLLATTLPAFAKSDNDHATFGNDVTIAEGETSGDIACVFCDVHIHGDVEGDVAVLFGKVEVDAGRSISGDVAAFGADLNLGPGATVGRDVAIAAGDVNSAPGAMIHGSSMVLPGRIWLLLPFAPFLILIGLIWLIVYIVRRNRYQFPVYPHGRGF